MNSSPADLIRSHSQPLAPLATGQVPVLPRLPGIRAVAFDIYGTLVVSGSGDIGLNDTEQQEAALRTILDDLGIETPRSEAPLTERFVELIVRDHKRSRARGVEHPEVEIRDIWAKLLGRTRDEILDQAATAYECASNPVWPMPGAQELLRELSKRSLPLGIVSNAQFYTPIMLEALFDHDLVELGFDPKLCFFSYQLHQAKPGLALYTKLRDALAEQTITPAEVLYVGNDALKDVHPAAALGFRTALFAGDQRSLRLREDTPDLNPPDAVITELGQILTILG